MIKKFFFPLLTAFIFFTGCAVSNKNYNPNKKYTRQELQEDYSLLRNILEKKHPALYWYTPKDSMNFYFDSCYNAIADSMTELQFGWQVLAPLTHNIHCGHTSFSMSNHWNKYISDKITPSFPLFLKVMGDTMVVTGNLNHKDSVIKKGMLINSINGIRNHEMIRQMFQYLPLDGYSDNVNYVRISGNFPYYHRNIFGIYKNYRVGYTDSSGVEKTILLPMFNPVIDTFVRRRKPPMEPKPPRSQLNKERRESYRSMEIDSTINTAVITLNTFSNGGGRHLRSFMRRSFKKIKKQQVKNCILDLRSNGGGDINMSALLTKYLRNAPFKVVDTAYAVAKSFGPYSKYIHQGLLSNIGLLFISKKKKDGNIHFGYWERHWFQPKTKNHFDGQTYVLINGPSFSATTIFCNAVKGQSNITLAGEETGGGWYGNSGLLIPDITLPNTKLKVRLPFFKIVQFNHTIKNGRGVPPDLFIAPTVDGVRRSADRKMEIVKSLIKSSQQIKQE
ncbi:S41 family peptidase [Ferruginibacter sp.]|uniref:S41 family peptidase n=1 Tax=Ferruginibacter sp. TaxID=1940288 RepID=UPI00265B71AC|nr:S41 family peptidase [Ferruginibacter sp.]